MNPIIPLPALRGEVFLYLIVRCNTAPPQVDCKNVVKTLRERYQLIVLTKMEVKLRLTYSLAILLCSLLIPVLVSAQTLNEILGRPTNNSVTMSFLPDRQTEVYWEYGTVSGNYPLSTSRFVTVLDTPLETDFTNLLPNTRYFYRTRYRTAGSTGSFSAGPGHMFSTQRTSGTTFRFTIEADPHPYDKKGSHTLWPITLKNQLADSADFLLDLGDTFGDDHNAFTITSAAVRQLHLDDRPFFGLVCHSSPLFFCLGNHEGESGYYLVQTPPNNLATYGTIWRKFYYPNPVPNGFYSGNTTAEAFGMGLPENYYAWEWGDALFVVLDSWRGYTVSVKPRDWEWTLGKDQYDWLKRTLETSKAKFKFVFAHHALGETRGGVAVAKLAEWGGYNSDGRTWGFDTNRPGWAMPIHQLMVNNGVNIFFQGHDHLFAKEVLDGLVYQEVPMPSDSTYTIGMLANADAYTSNQMDGAGHLRVTVSRDSAFVEYVGAYLPGDEDATHKNGKTRFSYSVKATVTAIADKAPIPTAFALDQNYPNPFNPSTVIRYRLKESGPVSLRVYSVLGKEVETLVNEWQAPGSYESRFTASDLPSGIYYYQLRTSGTVLTNKAMLLK